MRLKVSEYLSEENKDNLVISPSKISLSFLLESFRATELWFTSILFIGELERFPKCEWSNWILEIWNGLRLEKFIGANSLAKRNELKRNKNVKYICLII